MKKSDESVPERQDDGLEFPDWSGMDDSTRRLSVEGAFNLCEQYLVWYPEAARRSWLERRDQKRVVFTLE